MTEALHYTDLLRAHKFFYAAEERYHFYDAYMNARDAAAWFMSPEVPLKEGLLLFGFVHSWDPNFQGELVRFLQIYYDVFEIMRSLKNKSLIDIEFSADIKKSIHRVFDSIANCCKTSRYESTDASKILHAILPKLFVMWDGRIRRNLVEGRRDGRCYANEFMPNMQELTKQFLESYIRENDGDYESASNNISQMVHNYTLAKLIDEFNYARFTYRKTLADIRSVNL